jgi:hypothetical protein
MRKRTRRKFWTTEINPVTHALMGAALLPESELNKLRMRELAAIEAFRSGVATLQDWYDINAMNNLCETMARSGVGPEALEATQIAQAALLEATQRFERTGKMGTTGPGLQAFREVYEFHDLQRQSVPRSIYERCIVKLRNRVKSNAPEVIPLN